MMWTLTLIVLWSVQVQVMSLETTVECQTFYGLPHRSDTSPSLLAELDVKRVTVGGEDKLNISWAVNIDDSVKYLEGTVIKMDEVSYRCEYHPHLAEEDTGAKQKWFHYLERTRYGDNLIQAANLPLPPLGSGTAYRLARINIPVPVPSTPSIPSTATSKVSAYLVPMGATAFSAENVAFIIFGVFVALMTLTSGFVVYKYCGGNKARCFGFQSVPQTPLVPVPVLLVYPAQDPAFQQAVVELAEFLDGPGGCRVAVDIWQQQRIAELGPMRWLAEQSKAAQQVLIVCPQNYSADDHGFPQASMSATVHDIYLLILNMVASHAKSASALAKFWVVQLGKQQDQRTCSGVAAELRACRLFCLMKDLNKLCKSLHSQRQDHRAEVTYTEKSTVRLQNAVEKLLQRSVGTEKCGQVSLSMQWDCVDV